MNEDKTCFISYPRWTSRATAQALYLGIQQAGFDTFLDPARSIDPVNRRVVLGQITARTHFITLLPPGNAWLQDEAHSVFREELNSALGSGRHVVPVLLGNYDFIDLENDIKNTIFNRLQANDVIPFDYIYFDERVDTIITRLFNPAQTKVKITATPSSELSVVALLREEVDQRKPPDPDDINAEAAYFYAQKRLMYKDIDGAMTALTDSLRFNAKFAPAYDARGTLFKKLGDMTSAQSDYDRAISLNSQLHNAYMSRAQMHALQGDFQSAINDCTVAIKADTQNPAAYAQRGTVKLYQGDADGAIEDYTVALSIQPQDPELFRNRGMAYHNKGENEKAIEDFTTAINLNQRDDMGFTLRGQVKYESGDTEGAINDLSQAIALNPENAEAYAQRAYVRYIEYAETQASINDYTNAISRVDTPEARNNRGWLHRQNDQYDDAIEDYSVAIDLAPRDAEVYFNRAVAYKLQGNYSAAINDYNRVLELAPDNIDAYYNRGNAHAASENPKAAIKDFNEVITRDSTHSKAYLNRANAYRLLGKLEDALHDYNRAQELMPANSMVYNNRGNVRRALGDLSGARRDYVRATRLRPDDWISEHNARNFAPGEAEIEDDIDFAEGLDNFAPPPPGFGE